jgi:UDP-hydrolysing UDP-N-acetyl-D-glucosamine 2-epimerase
MLTVKKNFTDAELAKEIKHIVPGNYLLATFHPSTLDPGDPGEQARTVLKAFREFGMSVIITMPNADIGSEPIRDAIQEAAKEWDKLIPVENLGLESVYHVMKHARAMVGNSSSGLLEAPTYKVPVVNIGSRQQGRLRSQNVIDVPVNAAEIVKALRRATSDGFRASLAEMTNRNGDGKSAPRIVNMLRNAPPREQLLLKPWHQMPRATP